MVNEAQWPAPLAAGMGYIAVSHRMGKSAGLAVPVVAQWRADEVFWQGPAGRPGRAATCSRHLEKTVPGTCAPDALEGDFDREFGCLGTAVHKRLVLEGLDVEARMAFAGGPL